MKVPGLSRRDALRLLCSSAAAGCLPALARAADAPKPARMTLGFSTYGLPGVAPLDAVKRVAAAGFDAVEVCCLADFSTAPEKLDKAARRDLGKAIADAGLRLSALMENLPIHVDAKAHAANLVRLDRVAELARELNPDDPPVVESVLGGGADKFSALRDSYVARLREWNEIGRKHGVTIAIKPHRMNAVDSVAKANELLSAIVPQQFSGPPSMLRLAFDWSHYALRDDLKDATPERAVAEARPHLAFVAVKDVELVDGKPTFRLPGETGKTDHAAVLKALHAGGYRGDVNCEVSSVIWKKPGYDAAAALKLCHEKMSAAFEAAGVKRA
ncbi:MAG TPA: sugar phosphate isomerase/epimerase [Humisphaera sp.]